MKKGNRSQCHCLPWSADILELKICSGQCLQTHPKCFCAPALVCVCCCGMDKSQNYLFLTESQLQQSNELKIVHNFRKLGDWEGDLKKLLFLSCSPFTNFAHGFQHTTNAFWQDPLEDRKKKKKAKTCRFLPYLPWCDVGSSVSFSTFGF